MIYAVIKEDGTFVGRCCETIEEAREIAYQESGRRVFALAEDKDTKVVNSVLDFSEKEDAPKNPVNCYCDDEGHILHKCPAYDYECYYCDEYGYCELENPKEECEEYNEFYPIN